MENKMENISLYQIHQQMYSIIHAMELAESDEAKQTLEQFLDDLRAKADTLHPIMVDTIAEMDAQIAKYELELQRCQKIKKTLCDRKERIKSVLQDWVKEKGGKVQLDTKTLSIRKNPDSIQIDDEQAIINKLDCAEIKYTISKTKLKEHLINGQVLIDGVVAAHLESSESLIIR